MVAGKFIVWPGVNPNCVLAPGVRLIDRDQFGRGDTRLPRDTVAKIDSFADRRDKRERDKEQGFSNRARLHSLSGHKDEERMLIDRARFHFSFAREAAQRKGNNVRTGSRIFSFLNRNSKHNRLLRQVRSEASEPLNHQLAAHGGLFDKEAARIRPKAAGAPAAGKVASSAVCFPAYRCARVNPTFVRARK